jgi:hypothetical protein
LWRAVHWRQGKRPRSCIFRDNDLLIRLVLVPILLVLGCIVISSWSLGLI